MNISIIEIIINEIIKDPEITVEILSMKAGVPIEKVRYVIKEISNFYRYKEGVTYVN